MIDERCRSTVRTLMDNRLAISLFVCPLAMSCTTSRSAVRVARSVEFHLPLSLPDNHLAGAGPACVGSAPPPG